MSAPARHRLSRRLATELVGTGFLLATVVGSGIMAERLAGGNAAAALGWLLHERGRVDEPG